IGRRARAGHLRVANVRIEAAVVVVRLGEVTLPLEEGRDAESHDVVAGGARLVLVAVEKEQLVPAARPADRPANRITPVALFADRLRIAVELVDLAVLVPGGIPFDVIRRAANPVCAGLG